LAKFFFVMTLMATVSRGLCKEIRSVFLVFFKAKEEGEICDLSLLVSDFACSKKSQNETQREKEREPERNGRSLVRYVRKEGELSFSFC